MINRVLIRIKVIQMLYSYLLIEKPFRLEDQPGTLTKEKRFAYTMYLDMLVLMLRISAHIERKGGVKPLETTRFISRLKSDEKIRSLQKKYMSADFPYRGIVGDLSDRIEASGLFKNFLKRDHDDASDSIWENLLETVIFPAPELTAVARNLPDYTMRGMERMQRMMRDTFVNFYGAGDNLPEARKQLAKSLDKSRELYMRLLQLPVDMTHLEENIIDEKRNRYLATPEDKNPDMRFVENQMVGILAADETLKDYVEKNKVSWLPDDDHMLRILLRDIKASDLYREYMEFPVTDLKTDCELWRNIFKQCIFPSEAFLEELEDKSVFWNDDLEIIGTFVLKTMKRMEDNAGGDVVMAMYKDDEDARFGDQLFSAVINNKDAYKAMIDEAVDKSSWDVERLAFMDVVIVMTALAEIINFEGIPLTASLNEYIEIAKSYSTSRSGAFVNGLLATIIGRLRDEKRIAK